MVPTDTETSKLSNSLEAQEIRGFDISEILAGLTKSAGFICCEPTIQLSLTDEIVNSLDLVADLLFDETAELNQQLLYFAKQHTEFFEISDLSSDPNLSKHIHEVGHEPIRFFAGQPLTFSDGTPIGTLCITSLKPQLLSSDQRKSLKWFSRSISSLLESQSSAAKVSKRETQLKSLSESVPIGVGKCDATGNFEFINKAWEDICDLDRSQAQGFGWAQAVHADDKKFVYTSWCDSVKDGTDINLEFQIIHRDGEVKTVRVISNRIREESGNILGFVCTLEDITLSTQQKETIRKSNSLLNQTGALADVGGWELDLVSNHLVWSEQTYRIHGLSAKYVPDVNSAINFFAPEARPVIQDAFIRARTEGRGWDLELPLIKADGNQIWVRIVGQVERNGGVSTSIVGALQNVTDRVLQRLAIEYAHEQITKATESGNIGIWDWDPVANTLAWTPKMFTLFGIHSENFNASYDLWASALHPDDREDAENTLMEAAQNKNAKDYDTEFRIIWPDKSVRNIRATAQITRDHTGRAIRFLGVNWDVTPLQSLRSEIIEKHDTLKVTLQSIGDAVITTNAQGLVTWLNPTAEQMTGWLSIEAVDNPVADIFNMVSEHTLKQSTNPVTSCILNERIVNGDNQSVLTSRDGRSFGIENSAAPIFDNDGDLIGAILIFRDVSEQRRISREMNYRATHDSLTGLLNRIEFESNLQKAIDDAKTYQSEHSLLYIDMDQFKLVNDACGHAVGDQLLQKVSKLLSISISSNDVLARLGGDEFAAILKNTGKREATVIASDICASVDDFRFMHGERRFKLGVSIGVIPLDSRWGSIEEAIQAADSACFAAKDAGRNRVHFWFDRNEFNGQIPSDDVWIERLEDALAREKFQLHGQVINSLATPDQPFYVEALLQLQRDDGSICSPLTFLASAIRSGIIVRIDEWVVERALRSLQLAQREAIDTIGVNLSIQSILDSAFQDRLLNILERAGKTICGRLCFELSETAVISNVNEVSHFIKLIRKYNVQIALDRFGGYSPNYKYLQALDIDLIKISGELINSIATDPLDASNVRSIVDVASVIDVPTVAMHINDASTLNLVKKMKINNVQGHFLHSPEPIENLYSRMEAPVS